MNPFEPLGEWLSGCLERLGERRPGLFWITASLLFVLTAALTSFLILMMLARG